MNNSLSKEHELVLFPSRENSNLAQTPTASLKFKFEEEHVKELQGYKYNTASIYYTLISILPGIISSIIRKYIPNVPSSQILLMRSFLLIIPFLVYSIKTNQIQDLKANITGKITLVGIAYAGYNMFFFSGLLGLSISELMAVLYSSSIFTAILASVMSIKALQSQEKKFLLGGVIGVLCIISPHFLLDKDEVSSEGDLSLSQSASSIMAVLCAFCLSGAQIINHGIEAEWNPMIFTFYTQIVGFIVYAVYCLLLGSFISLDSTECIAILLIAICNGFGHYTSTKALELGDSRVVGALSYSQFIFSLIADLVMFSIIPSFITIVGALLILGCCITLLLNKERHQA